jgi:hypothetical protein
MKRKNPIREPWIFCTLQKRETRHFQLGFYQDENGNNHIRWKCMECGEYNRPKDSKARKG